MNCIERITATIKGEPVDRHAFIPVLSLYGARLIDCSIEKYYSDSNEYARGQKAIFETFRPDVLLSPFAFASIGAAFGSKLKFSNYAPNVCKPAIQSAKEWETLTFPDIEKHPQIRFLIESVERMAKSHKDQVPIAGVLPLPSDLPILVMGLEAWLETVLFDPDGAHRIMELVIPFFVSLVNRILSAGAMFVVLPCGFISPAIVTRGIATNFVRPVLANALGKIKGPAVLHQVGAPILRHLDILTGLPSTVGFALDNLDNLTYARKIIGPDTLLFGGPSGPNLDLSTDLEIKKDCLKILEERAGDKHFILCTAGADIPLTTDPENIHALRHAVEEYGEQNNGK